MGAPAVGKTKAAKKLLTLLKKYVSVNKDVIADKKTYERETEAYRKVRGEVYKEFEGEIAKSLRQGKNVIVENPHVELTNPQALEAFARAFRYSGVKLKILLFETTEQGLRKNIIRRGKENPNKVIRDAWKLANWPEYIQKYVKPFQQYWLKNHPLVHFISVPELQDNEERGAWVERMNWKPVLRHIRE